MTTEKLIENLQMMFDKAWEQNMSGNGTDISRMVTSFVPLAMQEIQAEQPTIDAVEVKHGRWIELQMGDIQCPVCEEIVECIGWMTKGKYNYCPNCGARMDGA